MLTLACSTRCVIDILDDEVCVFIFLLRPACRRWIKGFFVSRDGEEAATIGFILCAQLISPYWAHDDMDLLTNKIKLARGGK
jgi:hypothetical protein